MRSLESKIIWQHFTFVFTPFLFYQFEVSIRKEHAFKFPRLCERMSCEQSKKIVLQLQMFPKDHDGANVVIVPKI